VEAKPFTTVLEKKIRDRIHETFARTYPLLFAPFDRTRLAGLFVDKGYPSILVGRKRAEDPAMGREEIVYAWLSPRSWLDALQRACEQRGRRFAVQASVMAVFNDNLDPRRYWAIVAQRWRTLDSKETAVYDDQGFLLVNFDFDAEAGLKDFKIHYRLWFYSYRYDDVELGVRRHEKLVNDINRLFVQGVHGIDERLKLAMRDFLVDKVKAGWGSTELSTSSGAVQALYGPAFSQGERLVKRSDSGYGEIKE
jgi:hypothetical protein